MVWKCGVCETEQFLTLRELMQHINRQHGASRPFHVFCGIDSCPNHYAWYTSFYRHVKRDHSNYYESQMRLHRSKMGQVILFCFPSVRLVVLLKNI